MKNKFALTGILAVAFSTSAFSASTYAPGFFSGSPWGPSVLAEGNNTFTVPFVLVSGDDINGGLPINVTYNIAVSNIPSGFNVGTSMIYVGAPAIAPNVFAGMAIVAHAPVGYSGSYNITFSLSATVPQVAGYSVAAEQWGAGVILNDGSPNDSASASGSGSLFGIQTLNTYSGSGTPGPVEGLGIKTYNIYNDPTSGLSTFLTFDAVPEPSSALLISTASLFFFRRRRVG